jgi:hypothetical protein
MISAAQLRDARGTVEMPVGGDGEQIAITFKLAALSGAFYDRFYGSGKDQMKVPEALELLDLAWDLVGDDGEALPVTIAAVDAAGLPGGLLVKAAINAVVETAGPKAIRRAVLP